MMKNQLYTNVSVFDGVSKGTYLGEVLIQGNRIKAVVKGKNQISKEGAEVIDGQGSTLMPGLVNCHGHISYPNLGGSLSDIGDIPPEEHMLLTVHNAKTMIDYGFTAVVSAAAAKPRLDIVLRNEIEAGRVPGPRLRACTPQFNTTAGPWDARQLHMDHATFDEIADGPIEFRRKVRMYIREGVDMVKLSISGDNFSREFAGEQDTTISEDEIAAATEVAHSRGVRLCSHSRSDQSVLLSMKYGIEIIHHATHISDRTVEKLGRKSSKFFVCPALGITYATAYEAQDWGVDADYVETRYLVREFELGCKIARKLVAAGVKVLPFGDYGVAWNPLGTDSRDLEHFVNQVGFSPAQTLTMATKWGGECYAGVGNTVEIGEVKEDYLADLIMIDGDPLSDITLFQDQDNFLMIMKNGEYHKKPRNRRISRKQRQVR
mgnify:CR=1 FL=1|tara:strand:- start:1112 stop:2410 length:1299 start_codon:yes stop_codon:yes gene_type:complete